jgi:uncharacterized protein (TIGR02246 family)
MKAHAAFLAALGLLATLGLVAAQDRPAAPPAQAAPDVAPAAVPAEREPDVRAIRDLLAAFLKAYNAKDAKAVGDQFTADAEIEDEDGAVTRGRDAIVERFTGIFKESKANELTIDFDSLRFLGTDIAIEEGTASLSTGKDTPPVTNRYSVIYARQGGRWLHARVRDEPPEDDAHDRLVDLEWMLGEWVNESDDELVRIKCTWSKDGNFLLRDFDVKVEGRIALSGTQRIGWDAQRKQFRTWIFDDRGGFAEGLMSRGGDGDGDRWVVKVFDRTLGGEAIADEDRFTLVRPAPKPGK